MCAKGPCFFSSFLKTQLRCSIIREIRQVIKKRRKEKVKEELIKEPGSKIGFSHILKKEYHSTQQLK